MIYTNSGRKFLGIILPLSASFGLRESDAQTLQIPQHFRYHVLLAAWLYCHKLYVTRRGVNHSFCSTWAITPTKWRFVFSFTQKVTCACVCWQLHTSRNYFTILSMGIYKHSISANTRKAARFYVFWGGGGGGNAELLVFETRSKYKDRLKVRKKKKKLEC